MGTILQIAPDAATTAPECVASDARRGRMVDAADTLLGEAGLEGLTIRAVLTRTSLARRAFYECFAGKDDLVLAVFERSLRLAARQFGEQIADIADPVERIRVIVMGIILGPLALPGVEARTDRRSTALSREHLRLAEARPRELQEALRPLMALIVEQVDAAMRSGELRSGDPALQARLIYNLVATITHTELLTNEGPIARDRRLQMSKHIWEFCRRAIVA